MIIGLIRGTSKYLGAAADAPPPLTTSFKNYKSPIISLCWGFTSYRKIVADINRLHVQTVECLSHFRDIVHLYNHFSFDDPCQLRHVDIVTHREIHAVAFRSPVWWVAVMIEDVIFNSPNKLILTTRDKAQSALMLFTALSTSLVVKRGVMSPLSFRPVAEGLYYLYKGFKSPALRHILPRGYILRIDIPDFF